MNEFRPNKSIVIQGRRNPVESILGGVDYLRLTTGQDIAVTAAMRTRLELVATQLVKKADPSSVPVRSSLLGYVGVGKAGIFGGASAQGLMIQASGASADDLMEYELDHMRPSRLDIQATFGVEDPDGLIAEIAMFGLEMKDARHKYWGKVSIRHVQTYGEGDTLYIGKRTSPRFARIYNKSAEDPKGYPSPSIRFEVEYKDDLARRAWYEIRKALNRNVAAYSMIVAEMARSWVYLPSAIGAPVLTVPKREPLDTSDEEKLAWLARQVRPTVKDLISKGVSRDTMERVLGLKDETQERLL